MPGSASSSSGGSRSRSSDSDALLGAVAQLVDGDRPARRVLVVEDDDDLAQVLAASLEQRGLRVAGGIDRWRRRRASSRTFLPDLIVLDIVAPRRRRLRASSSSCARTAAWRPMPLVVYTASELDARRTGSG